MSASLVGSEMCIRDRPWTGLNSAPRRHRRVDYGHSANKQFLLDKPRFLSREKTAPGASLGGLPPPGPP
eukprot:4594071-Alexandrium_andersonii.AAC.1